MKNYVLYVLFALTAALSSRVHAATTNGVYYQIPSGEYDVLVELFNQTSGPNWRHANGWLDPTARDWDGVSITGCQHDANGNVVVKGNVTDIKLDGNNLSGAIPSSLGNLSQLHYLDLDFNNLSGSIPSSLGNLAKLSVLDLEENNLSGSIPSSLGDLSQLHYLNLSRNQLSGSIPSSLGYLSQLTTLELRGNQLSGSIPSSLGNLAQLTGLGLGGNQLSGSIPSSLGNLAQLTTLELWDNQLSGDMPEFTAFKAVLIYVNYNYLNIAAGSQSLANIHAVIAASNSVYYSPQYAFPTLYGHVSCICDGSAIAGALVQVGTFSATSDNDGSYRISNVPPGSYTATISATHFATQTTNLTVLPTITIPVATNDFYLTNQTFVINAKFEATITTDANVAAITNAIRAATQVYKQTIANPMCVTILFALTSDPAPPGRSLVPINTIPYSEYLAALQANPNKSVNDTVALASLPTGQGTETGLNGDSQTLSLTAANLVAIGKSGPAADTLADNAGYYGTIFLNVTDLHDFQSIAAHEINEVLGIGGLGSTLGNSRGADGLVGSMDLFRYSAYTNRSYLIDSNAIAYFSIDGGISRLVYFNQNSKGDFGDWGNGVSPANQTGNTPPQVQDAFRGSGHPSVGANEFIALDVVGYTLMSPPSAISTANFTAQTFSFGWTALPGQSYQVQFTTNLGGKVWNDLGGPITASTMTAGFSDPGASTGERYYRIVASSPNAVAAPSTSQPHVKAVAGPYNPVTTAPPTRRFLRASP